MAGEKRSSGRPAHCAKWLGTAGILGMLAGGCVAPGPAPLPPHAAPQQPSGAVVPEVAPAPASAPTAAAESTVAVILPTVTPRSPYAVQGVAPELTNDVWLNSEPLRLADLRGKVVLIDFWTYG